MENDKFFNADDKVLPVGIFRTDRRGLCRYVSAGWTEITGLSLEQALEEGWVHNLHPEDRDRVTKEWSGAAEKGLPFQSEYRFQRAEGKTTWVLGQAEAERDSLGNISGYIGTITDLTENKQTEERLKSSHHLLNAIRNAQTQYIANGSVKLIFDNLLGQILKLTQSDFGFIGEIFHTPEGKPYLKTHTITNIAWNVETRKLYDKYTNIGMEFHNLNSLFGAVITTGKPVISNEPSKDPRRCGIPDGHPPLNSFFGLPFHHGETMTGMVGIANRPGGYGEELIEFLQPFLTTCSNLLLACKNDERRKLVEEALRESEKKYKGINDQMRLILEGTSSYSGEEYVKSLVRQLARALKVRHAIVGELTGENNDRIRTFAFWSNGKFVDNLEYEISGTPCEKVLEGKNFFFQKDVRKKFSQDKYMINIGIESYMGMPLFDNSGHLMGILNVFHDKPLVDSFNGKMILSTFAVRAETEIQRQRTENALKESEQRFRDVLDNTPAVMYIKDLEGRHIQVNCQFEKLMNLTHEQIAGKTDHDLFPKGVADAFTANDRKVLAAKKPMEFEEVAKLDDGLHTNISIKFPLKGSDGKIYALCGMSTDITQRKKSESLIVGQNQALEMLAKGRSWREILEVLTVTIENRFEDARCSLLFLDKSGKYLHNGFSPRLPENYTKAIDGIFIGPDVGSCGTAAYKNEVVISEDIATDSKWSEIKELALKNGLRAAWSCPICDKEGKVLGTFCIYFGQPKKPNDQDLQMVISAAHLAGVVFECKKAEEQIKKSLEEKELLLKEIHHRTKNNMQIVSSLLWLQSKDIREEQSRELFRDCSNRVLSMALVHEKMYESPNFLGIDYKKYLISLVSELAASYGLEPDQIELVVDTNNLSLDLKSGIPCGLLIQELVCNSLKHAFPNGQKGEIRISLRPLDGGKIEMTVSDSGIGFPEGFDIRKSKSLGLQLVTMLVEKQLGGTLEFNGNGRSEFKLVFEKGKL